MENIKGMLPKVYGIEIYPFETAVILRYDRRFCLCFAPFPDVALANNSSPFCSICKL